ncbi:MAG: ATP-dependent helicase HrpB [Myxococcota bacterium]
MLPIEALKDDIVRVMTAGGRLVLEAPPGAGKTTQVPRYLLDAGIADRGEIIVVQPRRLACRMAARFVSRQLGEKVGERVGYQVRFEEAVSAKTQVRFVTEGLLVRELIRSPKLHGVACVVFDEFHERHLDAELALTLCAQLKDGERSDLGVIVMSATLDAEPIADWLDAERLRSEGRRFPVTSEYVGSPGQRPLEQSVAAQVKRALNTYEGDVLVFLPGVGEIMRCMGALGGINALVLPLHGELSPEEQDRAVNPGERRKVVLATNVAETSVTIDGIGVVVDTGLARVAAHDPWTGMPTLKLQRISRASADQRAGRAGRTRAGHCIRMFAAGELVADFDTPEIQRLDLCDAVLTIRSAGYDPASLPWFEPPRSHALEVASELLVMLGALDGKGTLTAIGRDMLRYPAHPRLGRVMVEARRRGVAGDAALIVALLAERDVTAQRRANMAASADVIAIADAVLELERARFDVGSADRLGLRLGPVRQVLRARDQLRRIAGNDRRDDDVALRMALLAGFPDRVAKVLSRPRDADAPLATYGSGSALLSRNSVVGEPWLIALDAEQRGQAPLVRSACAIESDWLIELFADRIIETDELVWNAERQRVDRVSRMSYGALTIDEDKKPAEPSAEAAAVLMEQLKRKGLGDVLDVEMLEQLKGRVTLARANGLDLPSVDELLTQALANASATSFAQVRDAALLGQVQAQLAATSLDSKVPATWKLSNGKSLRIHYEAGKPPWVESFLQDFFGTERGPRILDGRVALTMHLLGPNKRPLQVTSDLASFWDTHYPELKPQLSRRYPRHHWPDNPRTAQAEAFKKRLKSS